MPGDYFFDRSVTEKVGIYRRAKRESCPFSRAGRFIFYAVSDPLFALKTVELIGDLEPKYPRQHRLASIW